MPWRTARFEDSERQKIAETEHRVRAWIQGENAGEGFLSSLLGRRRLQRIIGSGQKAMPDERRRVTSVPQPVRRDRQRAACPGDPPASRGKQMLDRQSRASLVLRRNAAKGRLRERSVEQHERGLALPEFPEQPCLTRLLRRGNHQSIHVPGEQVLDPRALIRESAFEFARITL